MKKIISVLILFILVFSLSSCFLYGEKENISVGDLVYLHIKTNTKEYYCVVGLSEEGKEKREITIPSEVKGLPVEQIGFIRGITRVGSITSDNLEIIYIEKYMKFSFNRFFKDCPKLEKIICLEFEDKVEENYDYNDQYVINNEDDVNEEIKRLPVYVYPSKDFVEDNQDGLYVYANIIYYIDEKTVYYIDYYDNGKIENFPVNPVRIGYKFIGWYKEPECINKWDLANDNLNEIIHAEFVTQFYVNKLYAKWEEIKY